MTNWIDRLKANGADANHPASVQRHAQPDLRETEVFQRHLDRQNEQSRVDAHFQAQENFLKHDVEPLHSSDWNYTVPDDFRNWDSNQQLGYLYKMLCASNNKDVNPENLHINRQVFEQAINALPGDVPIKIITQLRIAYDHPEKIEKINVDNLIGVKGNYRTWIRGENLNHKEESGRGLDTFLAGYEQSIHEYNSGPVDCEMSEVRGMGYQARTAIRALIDGDSETASQAVQEYFNSKIRDKTTDDIIKSIVDGATVTKQTIESLNRMSKTDRAGKISGASLKDSQWNESSDSDVKQSPNTRPRMDWFNWK